MKTFIVKWIIFISTVIPCQEQTYDRVLQKNTYTEKIGYCEHIETSAHYETFTDSLEAIEWYRTLKEDPRVQKCRIISKEYEDKIPSIEVLNTYSREN